MDTIVATMKRQEKKKKKDKPGPDPERLVIEEDPEEALRQLLRKPDRDKSEPKDNESENKQCPERQNLRKGGG